MSLFNNFEKRAIVSNLTQYDIIAMVPDSRKALSNGYFIYFKHQDMILTVWISLYFTAYDDNFKATNSRHTLKDFCYLAKSKIESEIKHFNTGIAYNSNNNAELNNKIYHTNCCIDSILYTLLDTGALDHAFYYVAKNMLDDKIIASYDKGNSFNTTYNEVIRGLGIDIERIVADLEANNN